MDRHDLHRALGCSPCLSLPRPTFTQVADILEKLTRAYDPARLRVRQQLAHIAGTPRIFRPNQSGPIVRQIEKTLQQVGNRTAPRTQIQLGNDLHRPYHSLRFVVPQSQAVTADDVP